MTRASRIASSFRSASRSIRKRTFFITPAVLRFGPAWSEYRRQPRLCVNTRSTRASRSEKKLISVLFLGNSLTYFNEMPRMTARIGARESPPLLVDAVTESGADLEDLWFRTDALKHIWQSHWDYVVIQERGGSGAHDQGDLFHRYLGKFADEVRKSGATPLLFMTWYERYPAEQEAFMRGAARRARVQLLPVGLAWKHEFDWDGVHPNLAGSYLIACSLYSVVYKKPAFGAPFDFRDLAMKNEFYDKPLLEQSLNEEQARTIQLAAWNAVKNR